MITNYLSDKVERAVGNCNKLLLAFSGGLDSTVLLHLLLRLRQKNPNIQLRAVHVHHGLSSYADDWVDRCRQQCATWRLPFTVERVKVHSCAGIGIEAAARTARYSAFSAMIKARESLITAQHLDDQSETFLLALKRGSGPNGLSAMAACSSFSDNHVLLRPLLSCSRRQIEFYARDHNLSWIDDDSNHNLHLDRNFLRLRVLPLLNHRWPHFASAVARSANLCAEQEKLLDELLDEHMHALLETDNSLAIDGLTKYSMACRFFLLRSWIAHHRVRLPSRKQLQHLWKEVVLSRADATPQLKLGTYQIRRFRSRLYLLPIMKNIRNIHLNWSRLIAPLTLPDGMGSLISSSKGDVSLRKPCPMHRVSIRFYAHGRVRILGRSGSRPIKKLWQELSIPPWMRERIPLVYYDEHLIAAIGAFICKEGEVLEKEEPWRLYWDRNDKFNVR